MKKLFRYLLVIATVLFILIGMALLIIPRFFNTDAFKYHIEHILTEQLQRVVQIQDVSVSFFPDIGFNISGITLGNARGFAPMPQAHIQSTNIYLEIWPLFEKKIVFKRILFQGLLLHLDRQANGKNNWDDLLTVCSSQQKASVQNEEPFTADQSFSLLTLGSVVIKDAEIRLNDRLNNQQVTISRLTYQCTGLLSNIIEIGCDIFGTINYKKEICHIDSHVELNGRGTFHLKKRRYSIEDADLRIDATTLLPDDRFVESHLDANLAFSADHGALELSDMVLQLNDIQINGDLYVWNLFKIPSISGHLYVKTEKLMDTLAFFSQSVGFDGPVSNEITFQTRGKTIPSMINHLNITMQTDMGAGKVVLPESFPKKYDHYLQSISSSTLEIHIKSIKDLQKKQPFNYIFQTSFMGSIKQLNSAVDLKFKTQAQVMIGQSLRDIIIDMEAFDIRSDWNKLPGTYFVKGKGLYDLKEKIARLPKIVITGPNINAKVQSELILQDDHQSINSHVDGQVDHVRDIFSAFSISTPHFTDSRAFKTVAFNGDIMFTKNHIQFTQTTCHVDDAVLKGNLSIQYDPSKIDLNVTIDRLNADRYWIKWPSDKKISSPSKINTHLSLSNPDKSFFQTTVINANAEFNHLTFYNLLFDQAQLNVQGEKGVLRMSPISGSMYGGNFKGHWTVDYRPQTPKTSLLFQCKNILIGNFLTDYIHFNRINGRLNMTASLSGDINGRHVTTSSINGNAMLELTDAAISGIQIVPTEVQKQLLEMHEKKNSSLVLPKQQFIKKMTGQVTFRNGLMSNSDMIAFSKRLNVKGNGTLDLVKQAVDYTFQVRIIPLPMIPYQVKGSIWKPRASLDTSKFLKSAVSSLFKHAGNLGPDAIKDTLDIGGKALDVNIDPLQKTVEKSSEAIKNTINKGSGTIKDTLGVGSDALEASKEALQSLGSRLKGLFQRGKEDKNNKENEKGKKDDPR